MEKVNSLGKHLDIRENEPSIFLGWMSVSQCETVAIILGPYLCHIGRAIVNVCTTTLNRRFISDCILFFDLAREFRVHGRLRAFNGLDEILRKGILPAR